MEFPQLGTNCALTTCKQLGEFVWFRLLIVSFCKLQVSQANGGRFMWMKIRSSVIKILIMNDDLAKALKKIIILTLKISLQGLSDV